VAYLNAEWVRLGPRLGKEFHVVDAGLPVAEIAEKISIIYISNLKQKLNYKKTNTKSN
jgi:phospholipid N-methyltransferase